MTLKRHPWIRALFVPAFLLLITLGFFWRILFTPDTWKPAGGGDLVSFLFPTYRFAAASLRSGQLPLWQPHLYGGAPFLADMQSGLFYPPNLILFLLAPDFPYEAMEWMAVLHIFLAGLFMYLCLRYLEPGRPIRVPAALTGAIAYMFSDLFIVHFGNLNLIAVAAWLPVIFLLFWRALRTQRLSLGAGSRRRSWHRHTGRPPSDHPLYRPGPDGSRYRGNRNHPTTCTGTGRLGRRNDREGYERPTRLAAVRPTRHRRRCHWSLCARSPAHPRVYPP